MKSASGVFLWTGLLVLMLLFVAPQASLAEAEWRYHTCFGERVVLYYPSLVSEQDALEFLHGRDAAVQFVEEFFGVQLDELVRIRLDVSLLSTGGGASNASWDRPLIIYQLPIHELSTPGELGRPEPPCHEEAHIVASYAWVTTTRNPALDEGLAVAIDFLFRPHSTYDPHLVAKGLALEGLLTPLEKLLTLPIDHVPDTVDSLNIYLGSGSFFLFLFEEFGLDPVTSLFELSASKSRAVIPTLFKEVFGAELHEVEQTWLQFLDQYSSTQELRAIRIVQALTHDIARVMPLFEELETYWMEYSFEHIGTSGTFAEAYERFLDLLVALGGNGDEVMSPKQIELTYENLHKALADVEAQATIWLGAIESRIAAMDSLSLTGETDFGWRISLLEAAAQAYALAGDNQLEESTHRLCQALQFFQEGRDALAKGESNEAEAKFALAREYVPANLYPGIATEIERFLIASNELVL